MRDYNLSGEKDKVLMKHITKQPKNTELNKLMSDPLKPLVITELCR